VEAIAVTSAEDEAQLRVTLDGPGEPPKSIRVRDLQRLAGIIQVGLEGVANVLSGRPGASPGPIPVIVSSVTELRLTGVEAGSTILEFHLAEPAEPESDTNLEPLFPPPPRDLGFRAMKMFVGGLDQQLTADHATLPEGWDASVASTAGDLADFVQDRGLKLTLDSQEPAHGHQRVQISPEIASSLKRPRRQIRRRRTTNGRLIMVDLGSARVDVEESSGHRIKGVFPPEMEPSVEALVGKLVVAAGEEEVDPETGRGRPMTFDVLEPAGEATRLNDEFWANKSAAEQAEEQGVGVIESLDSLGNSELFSEQDITELLAEISRDRR
jgi:hypothetical protein